MVKGMTSRANLCKELIILYAGVVLEKNISDIDPRNRGVEGAHWLAPKVRKIETPRESSGVE